MVIEMSGTQTASRAEELVRAAADALVLLQRDRALDRAEFLRAQYDEGLAWVHFPRGKGGLGVPPALQHLADRLLADAGVPPRRPHTSIGYGMCAPAIVRWGTEGQQARYLRPLFSGEEVWCQLFSEPGAGSDLAGMSTTASWNGQAWQVDGQKVWTSHAHRADFGLLIARTDHAAAKYDGLSAFIVDMRRAGVEVRPLHQMTGDSEFNEVFFDDVVVEPAALLGPEGAGWGVALTTLMNERVAIGGKAAARGSGPIGPLIETWRARAEASPALTDRVYDLWIRAELLRLTNVRMSSAWSGDPGPIGSVGKLVTAELSQAITEARVDLLGIEGVEFSYSVSDAEGSARRPAQYDYLRARANSIEGGTSEIMKNIIGERVLGLPKEPGLARSTPWRDIPRGSASGGGR